MPSGVGTWVKIPDTAGRTSPRTAAIGRPSRRSSVRSGSEVSVQPHSPGGNGASATCVP